MLKQCLNERIPQNKCIQFLPERIGNLEKLAAEDSHQIPSLSFYRFPSDTGQNLVCFQDTPAGNSQNRASDIVKLGYIDLVILTLVIAETIFCELLVEISSKWTGF